MGQLVRPPHHAQQGRLGRTHHQGGAEQLPQRHGRRPGARMPATMGTVFCHGRRCRRAQLQRHPAPVALILLRLGSRQGEREPNGAAQPVLVAAGLPRRHERSALLRVPCRCSRRSAAAPQPQVQKVDGDVDGEEGVGDKGEDGRVRPVLLDALHEEAGGHPDERDSHDEGQAQQAAAVA